MDPPPAATTMETTAEATEDSALTLLLRPGEPFDCTLARDLAEPKAPEVSAVAWSGKPDPESTTV